MLLGDILLVATGKKADELLNERILKPIGTENSTLWRDNSDNVLTLSLIHI